MTSSLPTSACEQITSPNFVNEHSNQVGFMWKSIGLLKKWMMNQKPITRSQHTGTARLPAAVREHEHALIPPPPPPTPIFHLPIGNLYFLWHWPLSFDNSMEKAIHRQTAFSLSRMRMSLVRSDFFLAYKLFCLILKRREGWDRSNFYTKAKTETLILSGSNKKSVPLGFTSLRVSYFSKACIVAPFGVCRW